MKKILLSGLILGVALMLIIILTGFDYPDNQMEDIDFNEEYLYFSDSNAFYMWDAEKQEQVWAIQFDSEIRDFDYHYGEGLFYIKTDYGAKVVNNYGLQVDKIESHYDGAGSLSTNETHLYLSGRPGVIEQFTFDGERQWMHELNVSEEVQIWDTETVDGGVIVSYFGSGSDDFGMGGVVKIDNDGNEVWHFDQETESEQGYDEYNTTDINNGFNVIEFEIYDGYIYFSNNMSELWKITLDGEKVFRRDFDEEGDNYLTDNNRADSIYFSETDNLLYVANRGDKDLHVFNDYGERVDTAIVDTNLHTYDMAENSEGELHLGQEKSITAQDVTSTILKVLDLSGEGAFEDIIGFPSRQSINKLEFITPEKTDGYREDSPYFTYAVPGETGNVYKYDFQGNLFKMFKISSRENPINYVGGMQYDIRLLAYENGVAIYDKHWEVTAEHDGGNYSHIEMFNDYLYAINTTENTLEKWDTNLNKEWSVSITNLHSNDIIYYDNYMLVHAEDTLYKVDYNGNIMFEETFSNTINTIKADKNGIPYIMVDNYYIKQIIDMDTFEYDIFTQRYKLESGEYAHEEYTFISHDLYGNVYAGISEDGTSYNDASGIIKYDASGTPIKQCFFYNMDDRNMDSQIGVATPYNLIFAFTDGNWDPSFLVSTDLEIDRKFYFSSYPAEEGGVNHARNSINDVFHGKDAWVTLDTYFYPEPEPEPEPAEYDLLVQQLIKLIPIIYVSGLMIGAISYVKQKPDKEPLPPRIIHAFIGIIVGLSLLPIIVAFI